MTIKVTEGFRENNAPYPRAYKGFHSGFYVFYRKDQLHGIFVQTDPSAEGSIVLKLTEEDCIMSGRNPFYGKIEFIFEEK